MDADSSVSADLVLSLCPHRALARRRPARVVRHGPGSRRAGRFVQLRKERTIGFNFNRPPYNYHPYLIIGPYFQAVQIWYPARNVPLYGTTVPK